MFETNPDRNHATFLAQNESQLRCLQLSTTRFATELFSQARRTCCKASAGCTLSPWHRLTLKDVRFGCEVQSNGQCDHQDGEEQQRLQGWHQGAFISAECRKGHESVTVPWQGLLLGSGMMPHEMIVIYECLKPGAASLADKLVSLAKKLATLSRSFGETHPLKYAGGPAAESRDVLTDPSIAGLTGSKIEINWSRLNCYVVCQYVFRRLFVVAAEISSSARDHGFVTWRGVSLSSTLKPREIGIRGARWRF